MRRTADLTSTSLRADVRASIALTLIAIPLCLGIAIASGAPIASGVIAGIVGGIVVGSLGSSQLMVTGPAAGLAAVVVAGMATLGSFSSLLAAVCIAGVMQLALGAMRVGIIGYYFPSSVIRGMIAGIGAILVLKQLPHMLGYDVGFMGDGTFRQLNDLNTFTALVEMARQVHPGAVLVSLVALLVLFAWNRLSLRMSRWLPAFLIAVVAAVATNQVFAFLNPSLSLSGNHLIHLPEAAGGFAGYFSWPDYSAVTRLDTWRVALTIAVVASLETLLSLDATDKLDDHRRESDANRELIAQGAGNTLCGLIGGLPVAGVIARSATNINAGARTRRSSVMHGVLILLVVATLPAVLNVVPVAAIAALLLYIGLRLVNPKVILGAWRMGSSQFMPFAVTMVAVVLTDLLIGIAIGLAVGLFFILADSLRQPALKVVSPRGAVLTRYELPEQTTFLAKASIERTLESIPAGSRVEIDARHTTRLDHDVLEQLHEFGATARLRGIDYRLVGLPEDSGRPVAAYLAEERR